MTGSFIENPCQDFHYVKRPEKGWIWLRQRPPVPLSGAQHLPSRIDRPIIFVSRIWGAITKKQFEKPLEESAIGESHTI